MAAEHDIFHHVKDSSVWEFLPSLGLEWKLPKLFDVPPNPFVGLDGHAGHGIYLTKFMILEAIAAILLVVLLLPAARSARRALASGEAWCPRGFLAVMMEVVLLFIRDELARPVIRKPHHDHEEHGHEEHEHHESEPADKHQPHEADRFVPYLATAFWFILLCNLLGLVPFGGSPTGALGCTLALALCTLAIGTYAAIRESGVHFVHAFIPSVDMPLVMRLPLQAMMFVIEVIGLLIRHAVLAVRLFANMMGGHTVLSVLLGFIVAEKVLTSMFLYPLVASGSVLGVVGVSLLELLVAGIQAYIFTFLSAIYIGMLVYPEH